jgi:hypothetical protein
MTINATYLAQFALLLGIVMAVTCYYLGKRKTGTPRITSTFGFCSAAFPPLSLIYLIVLLLKPDLPVSQRNG